MPYRPEHKAKTRARIVSCARVLFNQRGFEQVTIDEIMSAAELTRGGFYNHFANKEELYSEAVASIATCGPFSRALARRPVADPDERAHLLVDMYLADSMLTNTDDQCPLYALPSDVARSNRVVRAEYTKIAARMGAVFGGARGDEAAGEGAPPRALATLALCVGAMVLARTTEDASLARSVRQAARDAAHDLLSARVRAPQARARAPEACDSPVPEAPLRSKKRPRKEENGVGLELHHPQITGAKGDVAGGGRRPKRRK